MTIVFQEDWTDSNGAAWNASRWTGLTTSGTSVVIVHTNQGRMQPQGAAYAIARIEAQSGNLTDFDLTATFTLPTSVEHYFSIIIRQSGGWASALSDDPQNGYRFLISRHDNTFQFIPVVNGVRGTIVSVGKTWNTSAWNLRIHAEGTTLQAKVWQGAEPGTWDIEQTNASHASGIISMAAVNGSTGTAMLIHWDNLVVDDLIVEPTYDQVAFRLYSDDGGGGLGEPA